MFWKLNLLQKFYSKAAYQEFTFFICMGRIDTKVILILVSIPDINSNAD